MMTRDLDWRNAHRIRLHKFANDRNEDTTRFMIPDLGHGEAGTSLPRSSGKQSLDVSEDEERGSDIAHFYYDMKLAGGPIQCSDGDGTCSDMW